MGRIEFAQQFEIDADYLWMTISDFSKVETISFHVSKTELLSAKDHGEGVERLCTRYDGYKTKERVMEWNESAKSYRIDLIGGNLPFDNASMRVQVTPHAEDTDRSFISGHFDYTVKYGLIGNLLDRWYIRNSVQHSFDLYLAGIEYHLKTGKIVPEHFSLEMAKEAD